MNRTNGGAYIKAAQPDQTNDLAVKQALGSFLDQLTADGAAIMGNPPDPEAMKRVTAVLEKQGLLGMTPPDTAQQDDEDEDEQTGAPPLTPTQRAAKRDAKQFAGGFNNMEATYKARRADQPNLWPATGDLSPSFNANPLLGGRSKKGR